MEPVMPLKQWPCCVFIEWQLVECCIWNGPYVTHYVFLSFILRMDKLNIFVLTVRWQWSPALLNSFHTCSVFCGGESTGVDASGDTQLCHLLRGRDGSCCSRPGSLPAAFFIPPSLPLALDCALQRTSYHIILSSLWLLVLSLEAGSVVWHWATIPSLHISSVRFLASHPSSSRKRSLHSVHLVTSRVLLSYSDLIFAPTLLLISLSLSLSPRPDPLTIFWLSSVFWSWVILKLFGLRTP